MAKYVYGCKAIKFGTASEAGTMPELLTKLFDTYRDSVTFIEGEADIVEEYSDQQDAAILALSTPGQKVLTASTFDWDPTILMELKGGTVLNGMWKEPATAPVITKAVALETDSGTIFQCSNWRVTARFNAEIKKKGVSLLEVTMIPLLPMEIGTPTP